MAIWKLKDGKGFRGEVTLGVNAQGKPIRKYIQRKRRDDVQIEIRRLTRKFDTDGQLDDKTSLAAFLKDWLEVWVKPPTQSYGTYRIYDQVTRCYIIPHLGNIALDKLTGYDIQKFMIKLGTDGVERAVRPVGKPKQGEEVKTRTVKGRALSPTTIKKVHAVLKTALARAVKGGKLAVNPARNAETPKQKKFIARPLTMEQAEQLLKTVEGDRMEAFFSLGAVAMRKGEILGLRWSDFDYNNDFFPIAVNIRNTLVRVKGKGLQLLEVKSEKSRRTIKLPRFVGEALMRRQLIQEEERLDAGRFWKEHDLVFTNKRGAHFHPEQVNKLLDDVLAKMEVDHVRVHDLRHTAATLLLAKGVPMPMVQEILGHSSIKITSDIYGHVIQRMRDEAANALDEMYADVWRPAVGDVGKRIVALPVARAKLRRIK